MNLFEKLFRKHEESPLDPEEVAKRYRKTFSEQVKKTFERLKRDKKKIEERGFGVNFSEDGKTVVLTRTKRTVIDHESSVEVQVLTNPDKPEDFSSVRITRTTRSSGGVLAQTVIDTFQPDESGELIPLAINKIGFFAQYGELETNGDVRLKRFAVGLDKGVFEAKVDLVQNINILQNVEGVEIESPQELPNTFVVKKEEFKSSVSKKENIGQVLTDNSTFFVH